MDIIKKTDKVFNNTDRKKNPSTNLKENMTSYVLDIKPSKLIINNFEHNKIFQEKIKIKNRMSFPLVLKFRSCDPMKLELSTKLMKISANQSSSLELKIRIDKKYNPSTTNSHVIDSNDLFIMITSEVFDVKYFIELKMRNKDNIQNIINGDINYIDRSKFKMNQEIQNKDQYDPAFINNIVTFEKFNEDVADINLTNSQLLNEINIISNKSHLFKIERIMDISIPEKIVKQRTRLNNEAEITINNQLIEENKMLKMKIDTLVRKLKEFEILLQSYSKLVSNDGTPNYLGISEKEFPNQQYNNILYPSTKKKNYMIETTECFSITINCKGNYDYCYNTEYKQSDAIKYLPNPHNTNDIIYESLSSPFYNYELPLEENLGLNYTYNYSKQYLNNCDFTPSRVYSYKSLSKNRIMQNPIYIQKEFEITEIDYRGKINFEVLGDNISLLLKQEKINIEKINLEEIGEKEEIINSIKERFIELELNNYMQNQNRITCIISLLDTIEKTIVELFRRNSINFDQDAENKENLENYLVQFEAHLKSLNKLLLPFKNCSQSASIERDLIKKLSTISQHPLLTSEELDTIYIEIQNITRISDEIINYKLDHKKFEVENCVLKKEIEQIRIQLKNSQDIIEFFKNDIRQQNLKISNKDNIIEDLDKDNQYLKTYYIPPEFHNNVVEQLQQKIDFVCENFSTNYFEGDDNYHNVGKKQFGYCKSEIRSDNLIKQLSERENTILELKSKVIVKDKIISNLKRILEMNNRINT